MTTKDEETMDARAVRAVVAEVLAEQERQHAAQIDKVVSKAVAAILTSLGIEEGDRKEMKADLAHLRKWRRSVDAATGLTFKVVITALVTGFIGAIWLGFKTLLDK